MVPTLLCTDHFFQNDLENGNGTFLWADGYRYTGAFVEGLKTGYGEYYYKNGDSYKGTVSSSVRTPSSHSSCFSLKVENSTGRACTSGPTGPSTWASTTWTSAQASVP